MDDFPGIAEAEPVVRLLDLVTVVDMLLEDAVVVADTVADRRQLQRRHRVQKAGGEPAETAIAERRVGFDVTQHVPVETQAPHCLAAGVLQHQVDDIVAHRPTDQELEREITNPFDVLLVIGLLRLDPAADQPVADGERKSLITVLIGRRILVLGERAPEMEEKTADQAVRIHATLLADDTELEFQRLVGLCYSLQIHVLVSQLILLPWRAWA